jgi:hypothetical protein
VLRIAVQTRPIVVVLPKIVRMYKRRALLQAQDSQLDAGAMDDDP